MAKAGLHLIVKCQSCGKEYRQSRADHLFCSGRCSSIAWRKRREKTFACLECSMEFKGRGINGARKYCSLPCRLKAESTRKKKLATGEGKGWSAGKEFTPRMKCEYCGGPFLTFPCKTKIGHGRFCSKACKQVALRHLWPPKNRRANGGIRDDLGIYVRSSWEANYARYLNFLIKNNQILKWEFEVDTFKFPIERGSRYYVPDFKVFNKDGSFEYHEVKGYMDQRSSTKLKRMAKYHPNIKIVLIDKAAYISIFRNIQAMIPFFEGNVSKRSTR
jgi:endogenous inhibitor of DNA gyrase (YacG/DUF329 family)